MGMKETKDMDCISTKPLTDLVLLRFLDGESDPETDVHLQNCLHCKQRATALLEIQGHLTANLFRTQCPSSQELGDYHLRLIPSDSRVKIKAHVANCLHCTRELAELEAYLNQVRPEIEITPVERVKILVAKLIGGLDLSSQGALAPAMVGVRGTTSSATMYEAGDLQLSLELQKDPEDPGKGTLLGLALGADVAGLVAKLLQDGSEIADSKLDDLGNFLFQDIPSGAYDLILQGSEIEIHIPTIAI